MDFCQFHAVFKEKSWGTKLEISSKKFGQKVRNIPRLYSVFQCLNKFKRFLKFIQLAISGYTIQKEEETTSDLGSVYSDKLRVRKRHCQLAIFKQFCDVVNNNDVKHQRKASLRNRSVWTDPYQETFFKRILMAHECRCQIHYLRGLTLLLKWFKFPLKTYQFT